MDLVGQFLLCKRDDAIPDGWTARQQDAWCLASHPTLPVSDVVGADGLVIGWLVGWPIGPEGTLAGSTVKFPIAPNSDSLPSQFESSLYEYGGRFVAVCLAGPGRRFYLDPLGSLAAVYCPALGAVASSSELLPRCDGLEDRIIAELGVPDRDTFYPFGLTSRLGIERLLPNHCLDLATWSVLRHWPKDDIPVVADAASGAREAAVILGRQITALAERWPLCMGLTAGRDSRMLLACSRKLLDRITFVTLQLPDAGACLDLSIARRMARRLRLKHTVIPHDPATRDDLAIYLHRTGNCVGSWQHVRMFRRLGPERPVVVGVGGELARFYHWRRGDRPDSRIEPRDLLENRRLPKTPLLLDRAAAWLETLPVRDALHTWSLLCLEQQLGGWSGPALYGQAYNRFHFTPFSHRRLVEIMLGLEPQYKRDLCFEPELIRATWPQLLEWPFNWPIGLARYVNGVQWRARAVRAKVGRWLGRKA